MSNSENKNEALNQLAGSPTPVAPAKKERKPRKVVDISTINFSDLATALNQSAIKLSGTTIDVAKFGKGSKLSALKGAVDRVVAIVNGVIETNSGVKTSRSVDNVETAAFTVFSTIERLRKVKTPDSTINAITADFEAAYSVKLDSFREKYNAKAAESKAKREAAKAAKPAGTGKRGRKAKDATK